MSMTDQLKAARDHLRNGQLKAAERLCLELLAHHPDQVEALIVQGQVYLMTDQSVQAYDCLARAAALAPDRPNVHNLRGRACLQLDRVSEAIECFQRALQLKDNFVPALINLGDAWRREKRHAEAADCLARAAELQPNNAEVHAKLGGVRHEQGQVAAAVQAYETVLRLQPGQVSVHWHLSRLKKYRPGDEVVAILERLAPKLDEVPEGPRTRLLFTLGKVYEDLGEYDRAFDYLQRGNRLKRKNLNYDVRWHERGLAKIPEVFTAELFERLRGSGVETEVPVFIIGMPRSGTTLLEQILASHPRVHGAGEQTNINKAAKALQPPHQGPLDFPENMIGQTPERCRAAAEQCWQRIRALAPEAARIVDKLPVNFIFTGLIHLLLPQSKIIHCMRDPIDTCLSAYSLLFEAGVEWCYDLEEMGRFHLAYQRLMAFWRQALPPGRMLEVQYEDVVTDLETQARRIIDYCGLEWDPACLSFHTKERPVFTPSAGQVRQPIYQSSVERWRRYEKHLGPLLAVLNRVETKT